MVNWLMLLYTKKINWHLTLSFYLISGLFLLLGHMAAQVTTGEKVVTEMGQQGALQSNYQHKEADITTWHFIFLDTFYSKERERETVS